MSCESSLLLTRAGEQNERMNSAVCKRCELGGRVGVGGWTVARRVGERLALKVAVTATVLRDGAPVEGGKQWFYRRLMKA